VDTATVLNFVPNGMIPTKTSTPHVPIGVTEVVEDVHAAYELGITIVHLHARDEATGEPTYRAEVYGRLIEGIRAFAKDLVVCVSLSGRTFQEFSQRAAPLELDGELKPDMGSLTLGSLNFSRAASVNAPEMIQRLATAMQQRGILPELEVFDLGMINYAKYLADKGLLRPPHYFNILFGNIDGAQADILAAGLMIRDLPPQSLWSMAGLGAAQLTMNTVALACGGGVRVGLEDNIWFDRDRRHAACNLDLVRRIHHVAELLERPIMPSRDFRRHMQLEEGFGRYGRRDDAACSHRMAAVR